MKNIKLLENFEPYDPYELMITPPNKKAEMIIEEINKKKLLCTMRHTKNIIKIINKFGKYKYPSLKELYRYCFNKEIENAHNSKYDVINLYDSIKKLYDDGILYYNL